MNTEHIPVLLEEVIDNLVSVETKLFVDATLGGAGHSYQILERFKSLRLVGIDADIDTLKGAETRLRVFRDRITLIRGNFKDLKALLSVSGASSCDGILFDLGLSMHQLRGKRGFSFDDEVSLDMRMDNRQPLTAYKVVNAYPYKELVRILREYGEEEKAQKIAKAITEERKRRPVTTATELADLVLKVKRRSGKLHPATKTFQAIRIEVNSELENLNRGIAEAIQVLAPNGKIGIISFHSLEDRTVKGMFKTSPFLEVRTKKPITPGRPEVLRNPASRSAKFRVAEKR
jgi:16S rRNA (cytosine1402-N4)-methyltransferase